jgi:hypothetical protein
VCRRDALARAEALESAATPQHLQWKALKALAQGPLGKTVRLAVLSRAGAARTVTLAVRDASQYTWATERRPNTITQFRPGVWYVDLDRITDAEFDDHLPSLAGASGIVFDLRGYPAHLKPQWMTHLSGGSLQSPLWQVPIVTRPDRKGWHLPTDQRWSLPPTSPASRGSSRF